MSEQKQPTANRYCVELTSDQMFAMKLAVSDAARWYERHGGDTFALRVAEFRDLLALLDRQVPQFSASEGSKP